MNTLKRVVDPEALRLWHALAYAIDATSPIFEIEDVGNEHKDRARRVVASSGDIIVVDSDGDARYSISAGLPARNEYGRETGYTWGEEYAAGRLYVGQLEDGDSYGAVWAQSALPEPA